MNVIVSFAINNYISQKCTPRSCLPQISFLFLFFFFFNNCENKKKIFLNRNKYTLFPDHMPRISDNELTLPFNYFLGILFIQNMFTFLNTQKPNTKLLAQCLTHKGFFFLFCGWKKINFAKHSRHILKDLMLLVWVIKWWDQIQSYKQNP